MDKLIVFSLSQKGESLPDVIRDLRNVWFQIEGSVQQLGKETYQHCVSNLSEKKRTGSENNLTDSLTYEEYLGSGLGYAGFAIGDIETLKRTAPYWKFLNDGAIVDSDKMMPPGHFAPGSPYPENGATQNSRWHIGPGANGKTYSFPVKYVVEGNHWLDKAIHRMRIRLAQLMYDGRLK